MDQYPQFLTPLVGAHGSEDNVKSRGQPVKLKTTLSAWHVKKGMAQKKRLLGFYKYTLENLKGSTD